MENTLQYLQTIIPKIWAFIGGPWGEFIGLDFLWGETIITVVLKSSYTRQISIDWTITKPVQIIPGALYTIHSSIGGEHVQMLYDTFYRVHDNLCN